MSEASGRQQDCGIARGARTLRQLACGVVTLAFALAGTTGTQNAVANGDTRTISIQHMHTKEVTTVTFKRDGRYDGAALEKLNWALRDWRLDEPTKMDPRLFDVAWEVHRSVGSSEPFHVVSAYRSPATNSMLRNRSRGVAKHSQHMHGKAMDFFLPDVSPARVREVGMRLQRGGVGYYPSAYTPFIHLDVGSVRSWPRMNRDQLVRLFPDGRTVHLPSSGGAMEGYEIAKADIIARGGSVAGDGGSDIDEGAILQGSRRSLWASLFGGDEEEDARPTRGRRATLAARPTASASLMAYANGSSEDGGSRFGAFQQIQPDIESGARVMRERSSRIRPSRGQPQTPTQVASAQPLGDAATPRPDPKVAAPEPPPDQVALPPKPATILTPVPFARPRGLAVTPDPVALPADLVALAPPPAPAAEPAAARLVAAPQPPARPAVLASVGTTVALRAGTSDEPATTASEPAPRLILTKHPAPPERPRIEVASLAPVILSPPPRPAAPVAIDERAALRNLFDAVTTPATSSRPARVSTAKSRITAADANGWTSSSEPAASFGFTKASPNDVRTDRFSGPAIRSLPTTYVQP